MTKRPSTLPPSPSPTPFRHPPPPTPFPRPPPPPPLPPHPPSPPSPSHPLLPHYSLEVFSLSGEHLREIRGDWWTPYQVLHFDGRLYLFETVSELGGESEDDEASTTVTAEMKAAKKSERDSVGKRVFALSLQGETLQVWRPPEHTDPILEDPWIYNMCTLSSGRGHGRVDHRLILRLGPSSEDQRFVALYGV